ncbi:MAG: protein kinase [Deltaproteobacteria bacterium]|nr:protein kinase [Deltaproteobacteria bacterium]
MKESRYAPLVKIASGGMASVWVGAPKDRRTMEELVALKRPHEHLLEDPGFENALVAEAEIACKLVHENVVGARELEVTDEGLQLVMDYVEGGALGQMLVRGAKSKTRLSPKVACAIVADACAGLEALHELRDHRGAPLGFVHRDVSPQNILIGRDGRARVTDFGLAKCAWGSDQPTTRGTLKGKLGYMAPEYIEGTGIDRRADVFAMGVVLWESLVGRRLFRGENDADTLERVVRLPIPRVRSERPELDDALDDLVTRALDRSVGSRLASAGELARGLSREGMVATRTEISAEIEVTFGEELKGRRRELERLLGSVAPSPTQRRTLALWTAAVVAAAGTVFAAIGSTRTSTPGPGLAAPPSAPEAPSEDAATALPDPAPRASAPSAKVPVVEGPASTPAAPQKAHRRRPRGERLGDSTPRTTAPTQNTSDPNALPPNPYEGSNP